MEQKPVDEIIEKIAKECEEAKASKWDIAKIVKELNAFEMQDSEAMRAKALELLKQFDPKAAKIFASFQKMAVRTSKQEIEAFDRGNIIKSLLHETSITRTVAEKIGREVEDKINDLQISYVNTALIRELVNVKLLEYGHESIRSQYTRIGMPVFEAEKKIAKAPYSNRAIMTEYNIQKIIPKELSDLHMASDIFISNIEDFSTKPIAFSIAVEKKQSLKKTVFESIKKASFFQKFFSWGINITEANIAIATAIEKKEAGEAADLFASALSCTGKKKPFGDIGLNLFVPETINFEVDNETMVLVANKMQEKIVQNNIEMQTAFLIDTKYGIELVKRENCRKISFVNCKKNYLQPVNGIASDTGISCFIGLNLLKQAMLKPEAFLETTISIAGQIKQLHLLKQAELEKRNYLKEAGIQTEKMRPAIGLFALMAACKKASQEAKQKKAFDLCTKTIEAIKKELGPEWLVAELENPVAANRFKAQNKKQFKIDSKSDEAKQLLKAGLQKHFFFSASSKNKTGFSNLVDSNAQWIKFKP